ncbi:dual specificity tyrosine-phosphorylation-regulated kinase 4-like [Corticium candelabrum]|uniref:dual specificity tyrosine-phosphorylation-regulated kinase 4-like n=1 Tax=Corticium candelabrum TaxID=121492 RepID=UPI002E26116C|nr:dual specificity tyrosine-phosphorylation-regulated kinase 4-like [Corticium candelabrum]
MTGNPDPRQNKRQENGKFDMHDVSLPPLQRVHHYYRSSGQTKTQTTSLSLDASERLRRRQARSLRLSSNLAVIKPCQENISQGKNIDTGQAVKRSSQVSESSCDVTSLVRALPPSSGTTLISSESTAVEMPLATVYEALSRVELEDQTTLSNSRLQTETDIDAGISLPMKPGAALRHFADRLSEYERSEIIDFAEIWFLGLEAKKMPGIRGASRNHGYDDDNGNYVCIPHDHLAFRYEVLEILGKGSFGQVVKALDHKTNDFVAVKIIRNRRRFHKQATVEVAILHAIRSKDLQGRYNVVHMLESFYFRNHLCIVFELLGLNLYELIKKNGYRGFSLSVVRRFAYALLQCLKLLYREKIIHCDLKPENILLKHQRKTSIKVIDFGSSCYEFRRVYTYIQSRFYRAPEVILGLPYGVAIDMWSLGCILCELYTGFPLFPGEDESEQLACIIQICGIPSPRLLQAAQRQHLFFNSRGMLARVVNSKGVKRLPNSVKLADAVKTNNELFVDFVQHCLVLDPAQRMSPLEALQHDWIREALKKTTTGAQPVADIVQPAATSEHLMSVGTDDETHRETSTRQKPSVALPPLKQHTQMTAPKSDIDLEVQAGQLDGMKNVGQTKNTSRLLNHKGSGNKGFLPQID